MRIKLNLCVSAVICTACFHCAFAQASTPEWTNSLTLRNPTKEIGEDKQLQLRTIKRVEVWHRPTSDADAIPTNAVSVVITNKYVVTGTFRVERVYIDLVHGGQTNQVWEFLTMRGGLFTWEVYNVLDATCVESNAYVLYCRNESLRLDIPKKGRDGAWTRVPSTKITSIGARNDVMQITGHLHMTDSGLQILVQTPKCGTQKWRYQGDKIISINPKESAAK